MDDSKIFIIGANGQLGIALRKKYQNAKYADKDSLDITDKESVEKFDWNNIEIIINAAAYTKVDIAETQQGRIDAWKVNAEAVANIVQIAKLYNITLVHISSDYVFDGTNDNHTETEPFSPLSVYGSTKAAGDILVSTLDKFYILRTSWVIGEGENFVKTMVSLANRNISPTVVNDQIGRLTFTSELARAIDHLLITRADYGTYNVSNSGNPVSWADITRDIFSILARDDLSVNSVSTANYYSDKDDIALRPLKSTLSLDKIHMIGFESCDWRANLKQYIEKEMNK